MLFDTHLHTTFSTDSKMTREAASVRAAELGIGISITEHMDLEYPAPNAFVFDADEYFAEYEPLRNDTLLLGIELGMRPDCLEANRTLAKEYPFDYVLGSVHLVENVDLYCEDYYAGRKKQESYEQYFAAMLQCVTTHDFIDSLGHIDYIARYARYDDTEIYYGDFAEVIDPVLKELAKQDKALEINTRRLGGGDVKSALVPIYRRFSQVGGRFVTLGSDAHRPMDIGKDFAAGLELAKECQLQPVYFSRRKRMPATLG